MGSFFRGARGRSTSVIKESAKMLALNPKTETDLTADYSTDYTDTIGYDYQCPEVLPRKDSYVHPPITPSKSVKSAESAVSIHSTPHQALSWEPEIRENCHFTTH
jgi:hypothetical protein